MPTAIPAGNIEVALTVESPDTNDFTKLFYRIWANVIELGGNTDSKVSLDFLNSDIIPGMIQTRVFPDLCVNCTYEINIQPVDEQGAEVFYQGQQVEAQTVKGSETPLNCDPTCQLKPDKPGSKVNFKIIYPPIEANLTGQAANNSILQTMNLWFKGLIDRVNFLKFFGGLRDAPGLKKATCDPTVPPYCKPVYN